MLFRCAISMFCACKLLLTKKWMWPAPLFIVAFFAPESPWWLVRKGRFDDAKRSLTRLTSAKGKEDFDAEQTIAMMRHTIASEKEVGHPSWDSTVRILMEGYCWCDIPRLFQRVEFEANGDCSWMLGCSAALW